MLLNLLVRPSQGSCFKVPYKRSKRPAPFTEEQNAKLQSKLWENHSKRVSAENQRIDVFYKKAGLKHFAIFTGKHLYWSLFLIQLQTFRSATLLKRDSNTGVFLWILKFFKDRSLRLYQKETPTQVFFVNIVNSNFCLFKSNFVQFNHFNSFQRCKNSIIWSSAHNTSLLSLRFN